MNHKKYLISFLLSCFVIIGAYISLFTYQFGSPLKASWWVKDSLIVKEHITQKYSSKKKIILLSGSNSLYGIDSKLLSEQVSLPVVNLSTHFNMGLSYLLYQMKKHAKEGDIVVLPLEFVFYTRETDFTPWFTNNIMCWDDPYFEQLSISEKLSFIYNVSPKRVLEGVVGKLFLETTPKNILKKRNLSKEYILKDIHKRWENDRYKSSYSYASLNRYGDIHKNTGTKGKMKKYTTSYLFHKIKITENFLKYYREISELSKEKKFSIFLTWPTTLENKRFSTTKLSTKKRIKDFKEMLKGHNINIEGELQDFHYKKKYFYDSGYHLNVSGKKIRTQELIKLIKSSNLNLD